MARKKNPDRLTLKEKDQLLKQAGYTPKESRLYRNRSEDNVMKLINSKRKETHKETFKPKTFLKEFKNLLKGSDDSREAVQKIYKEKSVFSQRKSKPTKDKYFNAGGQKVLILWKDVTENVGREYMDSILDQFSNESKNDLLQSAQGWRKMTFGEIGQYQVFTITDSELYKTMKLYDEYEKVYFGTGQRYKQLLEKINFMFLALYQSTTKGMFIRELVRAFQRVNPKVSKQLQQDFM